MTLEALEAAPGATIGPGQSSIGPAIYATPSAFISSPQAPNDTMDVITPYVIPEMPAS